MQADELDTRTHTLPRRKQYLRFYFFWLLFCDATSIQGDFQIHFCSFAVICVHWLNVHPVYLHQCHVFLNALPMGTPKKNEMETNSRCAQNSNGVDGVWKWVLFTHSSSTKTTALTQTSIKEYMEISAQVRHTGVRTAALQPRKHWKCKRAPSQHAHLSV